MDSENDFLDIPFRGIVEQSLAGVYVIQDEIFRYVNSTFAAIAGYTPQEVIGLHLSAIVPKEAVDEVVHNYYRRIRGEAESIRFITQGCTRTAALSTSKYTVPDFFTKVVWPWSVWESMLLSGFNGRRNCESRMNA